jgi:hypothetical protein
MALGMGDSSGKGREVSAKGTNPTRNGGIQVSQSISPLGNVILLSAFTAIIIYLLL